MSVLAVVFAVVSGLTVAGVTVRRSSAREDRLRSALRSALVEEDAEHPVGTTLEALRRIVPAERVLVVVRSVQERATFVAERSDARQLDLAPRTAEAGLVRLVQGIGSAGVASSRDRHAPAGLQECLGELGLAAGIAAALPLPKDGVAGVLLVGRSTDRRFTRSDRRAVGLVAERLATQLENHELERSVQALEEMRNRLRHSASHDALTGLPNRERFGHVVARTLEIDGPDAVAVLFVDLDDFKVVNDSLGHDAGDELLISVARRLEGALRPTDMAARLGGDEFAVLVRCIAGPEDGERVAARMIEALERPFTIHARSIVVRASVGIAQGAGRGGADELLRKADLAMYEAKRDGKGRFARFEPSLLAAVHERMELVRALERAVGQREILVHYQPIVDLASRELVAVEALARWGRDGRPLALPETFIGVADEAGLMPAIGRTVLRTACRQVADWKRVYGPRADLELTVNLAPAELHDPALVDDIAAVLEETGFPPGSLVLEITESGVMRKPELALAVMRRLRALGVRLALDDFGTGHSSLAHLRDFPLDLLKLARPFVERVGEDERDAMFVETIVRLAAALDLRVVAEGIEHEVQADAVAELGCCLGQGYLFSQPVGPLGMTRFLAAREPVPRSSAGEELLAV